MQRCCRAICPKSAYVEEDFDHFIDTVKRYPDYCYITLRKEDYCLQAAREITLKFIECKEKLKSERKAHA